MNVEKIEKEIRSLVKNVDIHIHKLRWDMRIEFSTIVNGRTFRVSSQSFYVDENKDVKIENVDSIVYPMITHLSRQIFLTSDLTN